MKKVVVVLLILAGIICGAVLPFVKQPEITKETKESLDISKFYGSSDSKERAKVISENGEALEERIRLISQAEEEIILSTFQFNADTSGMQMLAALTQAAERGVKVSVLVDGFPYLTTMWGEPHFLAFARMENVTVKVYNPIRLWKPWKIMGRMHDKYLMVDDLGYVLGGRNTYDFFLGDQPGYKNYDWDVLVYTKEADRRSSSMEQVRDYFQSVWNMPECRILGQGRLWKFAPSISRAEKDLRDAYSTLKENHEDWLGETDYVSRTVPVSHIELISNPTHTQAKEPVVFYTMTELMKQSEKEVVFHTPYIICNDWMLAHLKEVCGQADKVTMMTNSVANNGNPFGAMDYQKYKGKILDTGVQILEYDKGVSYHGKCFTVDDRISAVGSFNWDMRSAYLDTELMLVIDSPELNQKLREEMGMYEKDAFQVVDETHYEIPEGEKLRELSSKKENRIKVLKAIAGWARFLM